MTTSARTGSRAADPGQVRAAVAALCSPKGDVELRETHISWLFITADRAFKLKKPVVLDFLDYGSARRRHTMCQEEIRLNGRLAPDVYLGVRGIAEAGDRLRIVDEHDPAAIDYLVEMRRYDEDRTLAAMATRGQVSPAQLAALAALLARFHRTCPPSRDRPRPGSVTVRHEIDRNLDELNDQLTTTGAGERVRALRRFLEAFTTAHAAILDARAHAGRIREVHGDLRAEHVILEPTLSVVDCIEFDRGLRVLDVADDLAFLIMDLCALGAEGLARRLIGEYRRAGGDCGDDELVWFFAVHRALVRAKVELVRAGQTGGERAARHAAAADAFLGVAERCAWRARGPLVLVLCGVPASGKSHLAQMIASTAELPVLNSDVVRKELAGVSPRDRAPLSAYDPRFSVRTYRELGRRAGSAVIDRGVMVVDATFRHAADRAAFADGYAGGAPVLFAQCVTPAAVLAHRATDRDHNRDQVSDATAEIVRRERDRFEPLDEIDGDDHLLVRTDRPASAVIADLLALLDVRLAGSA
jgi:aminoglycoside phosphotransferase family enzyme/predicted kinase